MFALQAIRIHQQRIQLEETLYFEKCGSPKTRWTTTKRRNTEVELALVYPAATACGLVVRVLAYRSGGPGSIPGTTRFSGKKKKGKQVLERGPLSLVSTTEELLDRKVAAPV
jgi:hypothetical protein